MKLIVYLFAFLTITACSTNTTLTQAQEWSSPQPQDKLNLTGDYHWDFNLMGGKQNSTHTFYEDSIRYSMEGNVYETDYTMRKLSYESATGKWVGIDEKGVVYVLFIKNQADTAVLLYKHKCADQGLEEAEHFALPELNTTKDHGWNVYSRNQNDKEDVLEISGTFVNQSNVIQLSDSSIIVNDTVFNKKAITPANVDGWESLLMNIFYYFGITIIRNR